MATATYVLIVLLACVAIYLLYRIHAGVHEWLKLHGKMLVTCPETQKPAAVTVASGRAALEATVGRHHAELNSCSRWPERRDCGQDCLGQLEADPEAHRVWSIAARWYHGKECVYCGRPIHELSHLVHSPALINAAKKTTEWDAIQAEKLPEALSECLPVCWNCHVTETFIRTHPERVIARPWKH